MEYTREKRGERGVTVNHWTKKGKVERGLAVRRTPRPNKRGKRLQSKPRTGGA